MLERWNNIHGNNNKNYNNVTSSKARGNSPTQMYRLFNLQVRKKIIFNNFVYRLHSYIDAEGSSLVCYSLKTLELQSNQT